MITITPEYLAEQGLSNTIVERFWNKVFILPYDRGCWLWLGYTTKGYGAIGRGTADAGCEYAHRISWILHDGPIPDGLWVLHHCDEPLCVRPDHLFLGTQVDNMRDCVSKGRAAQKDHHGEKNPKHKLTWPEVDQIRGLHSKGERIPQIAQSFGVTEGTIYFVVQHKTWRK